MNEACETYAGNVSRAAKYAFKVPDGFCPDAYISTSQSFHLLLSCGLRFGVVFVQEPTTVFFRKDPRESPWLLFQWLDILDLNDKHIARFSGFNLKRTSQVMNLGEIDIPHIVSGIVVANLSASPVYTFNLDGFSRLDGAVPIQVSIAAVLGVTVELYAGLSGCQRFCSVSLACVCCDNLMKC